MRHVTVDLSCARISRQAGATQTGQRLRMDYTMDNEEREEWKRKKLDIHYYRKVGRSHTRLLILRKPRPTTPSQKIIIMSVRDQYIDSVKRHAQINTKARRCFFKNSHPMQMTEI